MNIYVGNLPPGVTADELRDVFLTFGEVLSVKLMNDRYIGSGQSREYAYVQMASKSQGKAAVIGLRDVKLRGQLIRLVEALPLTGGLHAKPIHNKRSRNFSVRKRDGER